MGMACIEALQSTRVLCLAPSSVRWLGLNSKPIMSTFETYIGTCFSNLANKRVTCCTTNEILSTDCKSQPNSGYSNTVNQITATLIVIIMMRYKRMMIRTTCNNIELHLSITHETTCCYWCSREVY